MGNFTEYDFTKINSEIDIFKNAEKAEENAPVKNQDTVKITQLQSKILAEASMELSINIGNLLLTIEDLIDLTPGSIFQYEMDKEKTLEINLSGNKIAEGRFVKDKDKLAIEIMKVLF